MISRKKKTLALETMTPLVIEQRKVLILAKLLSGPKVTFSKTLVQEDPHSFQSIRQRQDQALTYLIQYIPRRLPVVSDSVQKMAFPMLAQQLGNLAICPKTALHLK